MQPEQCRSCDQGDTKSTPQSVPIARTSYMVKYKHAAGADPKNVTPNPRYNPAIPSVRAVFVNACHTLRNGASADSVPCAWCGTRSEENVSCTGIHLRWALIGAYLYATLACVERVARNARQHAAQCTSLCEYEQEHNTHTRTPHTRTHSMIEPVQNQPLLLARTSIVGTIDAEPVASPAPGIACVRVALWSDKCVQQGNRDKQ